MGLLFFCKRANLDVPMCVHCLRRWNTLNIFICVNTFKAYPIISLLLSYKPPSSIYAINIYFRWNRVWFAIFNWYHNKVLKVVASVLGLHQLVNVNFTTAFLGSKQFQVFPNVSYHHHRWKRVLYPSPHWEYNRTASINSFIRVATVYFFR